MGFCTFYIVKVGDFDAADNGAEHILVLLNDTDLKSGLVLFVFH